jgi:tetratricopeptide (TPR) repeat protein
MFFHQRKSRFLNIFTAFFALLAVFHTSVGSATVLKDRYQHVLKLAHLQRNGQCSPQKLLDAVEAMQTTEADDFEFQDQAHLLSAHCYYALKQYQQAYSLYQQLIEKGTQMPFYTEAVFWAAESACHCDRSDEAYTLRKQLWKQHPTDRYAAEAYWRSFTLHQYLSCESKALKHLHILTEYFPNSHFQIGSNLLLARQALTYRHNHPHHHTTMAACTQAETAWIRISSQQVIPYPLQQTCQSLYRYAQLTKARTAIALATECSSPNKRQLTLNQATNLLQDLISTELKAPALYQLACIYQLKEMHEQAEQTLLILVADDINDFTPYSSTYVDAYRELSRYAIQRQSFETALTLLQHAEAVGKKNQSPIAQTLDLWIMQSICLHHLGRNDEALRMLSQIVNSPVASSLRIKAMCLRATVYQAMDQRALAIKQLQSIKRKGGHWKSYATAELLKMRPASSETRIPSEGS